MDLCQNKFIDLSESNATYRGGVRGRVDLDSSCSNSDVQDPTCYEEHLFRERTLSVIEEHNASSPLFLVHAFHLIHTPLEVPLSYISLAEDQLKQHDPPLAFDDLGRRNYSAMVRGVLCRSLRSP